MDTSSKALAACALAFGAMLYQETQARKKEEAKNLVALEYQIEVQHLEFLESMAKAYNIPDVHKAARIVIQYAISDGDAKDIFEKKRCNTCGGKKNKTSVPLKLYPSQAKFVADQQGTYNLKSLDKSLRCMLEFAQRDGNRDVIFATTRCKTCNGRG